MRPDDLQRIKLAAEDAGWLLERGYDALEVAALVAKRRALSDDERRLLDCSTRSGTNVKHHIARELDSDDVRKRRVRVDVESTLCAVASATQGALMLQSAAGLLCDPQWRRGERRWDALIAGALVRCCHALKSVKPKEIQWLVRGDWEAELREAWAPLAKETKLRGEVVVDDVGPALDGAAFVVSSDPAVLDRCATWLNLPQLALGDAAVDALELG